MAKGSRMVGCNYRRGSKFHRDINFLVATVQTNQSGLWWTYHHHFVKTGMGGGQPLVQMTNATAGYYPSTVLVRYWQIPSDAGQPMWLQVYNFSSAMIVFLGHCLSEDSQDDGHCFYTASGVGGSGSIDAHFIFETPIFSI